MGAVVTNAFRNAIRHPGGFSTKTWANSFKLHFFSGTHFLDDSSRLTGRDDSEVSMDFMANGLLALGAHPAMVHSVEELDVAPWPVDLQALRGTKAMARTCLAWFLFLLLLLLYFFCFFLVYIGFRWYPTDWKSWLVFEIVASHKFTRRSECLFVICHQIRQNPCRVSRLSYFASVGSKRRLCACRLLAF